MKIVISEFMDDAAVDHLRAAFGADNVRYDAKLVDQPAALAEAVADCDAFIVRNRTQVRGDLLAACGKARVIGRLGVGLDNIDVPACEARGMKVIPATGANALAVAEYVVGTAMMLRRASYQSTSDVASGKWPRNALSNGRETMGAMLGLIGFGSIGQLTAKLARQPSPAPRGPPCDCAHEVVAHAHNRIVAACRCDPPGCKTIKLQPPKFTQMKTVTWN